MKPDFCERIQDTVILADGALGTYIYEKGVDFDKNLDLLNLRSPDLVYSVHEEYIRAGSQLIETNTFGANHFKLLGTGEAEQVRKINLEAVGIALKAAGNDVYVAGSVGPTGVDFPLDSGEVEEIAVARAFHEQITALLEGGVDLIILETFTYLEEMLLALQAARGIAADIPIVAQMAYPSQGRTAQGIDAVTCSHAAIAAGATVVGTNCGRGVTNMLTAIQHLAELSSDVPLSAFPNAGLPEVMGHRMIYPAQPAYMAQCVAEMIKHGVRLVGGCCGTTPAHIHEFRAHLHIRPVSRMKSVASIDQDRHQPPPMSERSGPGAFLNSLPGDRLPILVELDPPTHLDVDHVLAGARVLADSGADAITLGEHPLAILRADNLALAHRIREDVGIQTIIHLTCRDRNALGLQGQIMGAHLLGIEAILAVTGDSASSSNQPGVSGVFDLNSPGLIRMISQYNQGYNMAGNPVKKQTDFSIGAAFSFRPSHPRMQISRLEQKASLGAHFAMTQPLFDRDTVERMVEMTSHINILIFPGIFPLISARNADFIHNEVPGISIPSAIRKRLWRFDKVEDQRRQALDITHELVEAIAPLVDGLYFISPLNKWEIANRFVRQVRQAGWQGSGRIKSVQTAH